MNRKNRLAYFGAAALLLVATGSVLANRAPAVDADPAAPASSHEPEEAAEAEEPVTAEVLAHAATRLTAGEIAFSDEQLADLAQRYGLGGAARVLAWADQKGMDAEAIAAMRDGTDEDGPMGWGRIAKELDVHPGIGAVMGNGGGNGNAHGHDKDKPKDGDDAAGE